MRRIGDTMSKKTPHQKDMDLVKERLRAKRAAKAKVLQKKLAKKEKEQASEFQAVIQARKRAEKTGQWKQLFFDRNRLIERKMEKNKRGMFEKPIRRKKD